MCCTRINLQKPNKSCLDNFLTTQTFIVVNNVFTQLVSIRYPIWCKGSLQENFEEWNVLWTWFDLCIIAKPCAVCKQTLWVWVHLCLIEGCFDWRLQKYFQPFKKSAMFLFNVNLNAVLSKGHMALNLWLYGDQDKTPENTNSFYNLNSLLFNFFVAFLSAFYVNVYRDTKEGRRWEEGVKCSLKYNFLMDLAHLPYLIFFELLNFFVSFLLHYVSELKLSVHYHFCFDTVNRIIISFTIWQSLCQCLPFSKWL